MIYEQFLGLSLKNTDLGQYFTPEQVIEFMVEIANLEGRERVLDPACGTGRFLVHAMNKMLGMANSSEARRRIKTRQLFGNEKSPYVTKIAKMNMFVHGDGRTNIRYRDSLELTADDDRRYDLILTNPPLGEIDFRQLFGEFTASRDWYLAMDVIEKTEKETRSGTITSSVSRRELKGGALFVNRFAHYLKPGAQAITVIDDAILNTDEYAHVREFIRKQFEIRGIFSLTDDAFKHTSRTATKTSLIHLIKKRDPNACQETPVFFAHAFQVGVNAKGKRCPNDLIDPTRPLDLLRAYREFLRDVQANVENHGGSFSEDDFDFKRGALSGIPDTEFSEFSYFSVPCSTISDRLEFKYYDPTYQAVERHLSAMDTVTLGAITDPAMTTYGLTETGLDEGDIPFINIENLMPDTTINLRGVRYVLTDNHKIRNQHYTRKQDILISRSRLPGIAAVVRDDDGLVYGSYIIRFHLSQEHRERFLPEYVALFINSIFGQSQVHRLKSGSNGYNINTGQLKALRIRSVSMETQLRLVQKVTRQRQAASRIGSLLKGLEERAEDAFIKICVGEEDVGEFANIVEGLEEQLAPLDYYVQPRETGEDTVSELRRVARRFEIRPTFGMRPAS